MAYKKYVVTIKSTKEIHLCCFTSPVFYPIICSPFLSNMLNHNTDITNDSEIYCSPLYNLFQFQFSIGFQFISILTNIRLSLHSLVEVTSKEKFRDLTPLQIPCCPLRSSNKETRDETSCGDISRFTKGITEIAFCSSVVYFRGLFCMFALWQNESYGVNKYILTTNEQANGRKCCLKKCFQWLIQDTKVARGFF